MLCVVCCCDGAQGWTKRSVRGRVWTRGGHARSKKCRCVVRSCVLFGGLANAKHVEWDQVWDGVSDARITFSMQDDHSSILSAEAETQLATLTENLNLQRGLLRYLDNNGTVELADKVKVQSIVREEREGGGWPLVHLSDGRVLRARLLVSCYVGLLMLSLTVMPGWRRRVQLPGACIFRHSIIWVGIRHVGYRRHTRP